MSFSFDHLCEQSRPLAWYTSKIRIWWRLPCIHSQDGVKGSLLNTPREEMRASVLQAARENPEERKKDYNSMTDKKDLREVKYISLLVEENPYSASPFRCAWVEIFELAQRPQPDRRLALTSLLVSHTNNNLFNWWKYCQRRRFVNVFNLRTKNKISVLSENRGSHNVKRGTGKARAVEMKHSCHLDTAEPEHIV